MSQEEPSKDSSARTLPASTARKPATSESRIQANRKNALRSTGPKTERGKRTVARNAIKHGILAREVVITAGDGEESLEEFQELVKQLWEDHNPVGVMEGSLVQEIASCLWRKARVLRAENGEIRTRVDTLRMERAQQLSDKANLDLALSDMESPLFSDKNWADQQVSTKDQWVAKQLVQIGLREHNRGLEVLSSLLKFAKSEIARDGYLSEWTQKRVFNAFHLWQKALVEICSIVGRPETNTEDEQSDDEQSQDEQSDGVRNQKQIQKMAVEFIERGLASIDIWSAYSMKRQALALDAEMRRFSLPPADVTDKLLRYESHLDKQLYRAMDQLERLQRRRRRENVPPPLNINLGRRK